eukprot:Transcript_18834.p3 GENE.Transcript_18834~~Transcript_18834.p3  ORF type:complete len:274 (-),score=33.38 Transcript_18834:329-1150(-)
MPLSWLLATAQAFGGESQPLKQLSDPSTFTALYYVPVRLAGSPAPLLLYLHGAGESGTDIRGLISEGATGTPPVELEHGTALPVLRNQFVTVAPQTSHGWDGDEIGRFVDYLLSPSSGLQLDPKRLYVTGHSMGGAGALYAAATKRFAAVVPVAPAGSARPADLRGVPLWGAAAAPTPLSRQERRGGAERLQRAPRRAAARAGRQRVGGAPHAVREGARPRGLARLRRAREHGAGVRDAGALAVAARAAVDVNRFCPKVDDPSDAALGRAAGQ